MRIITSLILIALLSTIVFVGLFWHGTRAGWLGVEHDAGTVEGAAVPSEVIAARQNSEDAFAPTTSGKHILFGDLHVHTTFSTDAFVMALPLLGGSGVHPIADACDFARYCSALDFWAVTDHAESITPLRWQRTKEAIRSCQAKAGDQTNPDLVSFVGFEWTQVGRTPATHFGHKNVIFRDLEDDKIAARPIAAGGVTSSTLRQGFTISPAVPLIDFTNRQAYYDINTFTSLTNAVPSCDPTLSSDKLPSDCFEAVATPGELVRRLVDEQKLKPLFIPHGSSWGMYTPPGSTWGKALTPSERPESFSLIEVFSGHGNSEEYRSWQEVVISADGKTTTCPEPTKDYLPSCWRAGQIIKERCLSSGAAEDECEQRAVKARSDYVALRIAGHVSVPGESPEDWLDAGQCTDCFLPTFNHRPGNSVQAGLASSHFETPDGPATRFYWGMIGSSDNHKARPGTGLKQEDRRENTESLGPVNATWLRLLFGKPEDPVAESKTMDADELGGINPLYLIESERQSSFFLTGGLAAVHTENRTREAIWKALENREVYATTGQRILLWFDALQASDSARVPMGGRMTTDQAPTFEVKAVGAFKQKPGCPEFAKAGLDRLRLETICAGECYYPSDDRYLITRIEVVKIRPQTTPGEDLSSLIQDPFVVHTCPPDQNGCTFRFTDPDYAAGGRDALYYVKAIQEPNETINAQPIQCRRDKEGNCLQAQLCYGDYRSGSGDCLAPAEHRAWSSPIYLDFRSEASGK